MIINRAAFALMVPVILAGGISQLQSTWGVPNSAVLGSLLWLHAVPTYVLGSQYIRTMSLDRNEVNEMKNLGIHTSNMSHYFLFHKVAILRFVLLVSYAKRFSCTKHTGQYSFRNPSESNEQQAFLAVDFIWLLQSIKHHFKY